MIHQHSAPPIRAAARHHRQRGQRGQHPAEQFTPHIPGCDGKRSFSTQKQAARRAKMMRRKYDEPLAEYFCRHCHRWHIGGPRE